MTFPSIHISALNTTNLGAKTTIVVVWFAAISAISASIAGWAYGWTQQVVHDHWTTIVGDRVFHHEQTFTHGLAGKLAFCGMCGLIWCVAVSILTGLAIGFWREQN